MKLKRQILQQKPKPMRRLPNKQKAIDLALWQNHSYQFNDNYGVVLSAQGDYLVIKRVHPTFEDFDYEKLPSNHSNMSYKHIKHIRMDDDPLPHWEAIAGTISILDGEVLRFILSAKVPLKRFIRYELSCRGYDEHMKWVGFDKAQEIWLR